MLFENSTTVDESDKETNQVLFSTNEVQYFHNSIIEMFVK